MLNPKKQPDQQRLEDYEPGATREEVLAAIDLVTRTPRATVKPKKRASPPVQASSQT